MKKYKVILLYLLFLFRMPASSQVIVFTHPEPIQPIEETNNVFDTVNQMPSFPGGQAAMMSYLSKNTKYPALARKNEIQGRVVCTFVVERDGSITDIQVSRGVDPSLDKEAIRVLSSMPHWIPGKQNGKVVRVKCSVPVTFRQ